MSYNEVFIMRRIGNLPDAELAERFCDYLETKQIAAKSDSGDQVGEPHHIWIREEADVADAKQFLERFRESPNAPEYDVSEVASQLRREKSERISRKLKQQEKAKMKFRSPGRSAGIGRSPMAGAIPMTVGFIALATIIGFATGFGQPRGRADGKDFSLEEKIFFACSVVDYPTYLATDDPFAKIKQGEIWRLVSPMLLHGGGNPMHLVFNMMNLFVLGGVVERIHGGRFYLILLLSCQAVATLTQILLPDWLEPPLAIGASGAVFGVFGFVWIRPKVDVNYPVEIPSFNVKFMLGFLVLCFTPVIANIANGAHVGGLLAGMAIAALAPISKRGD